VVSLLDSRTFLKNYTKKVPVGRLANKDDIKGVVVWPKNLTIAFSFEFKSYVWVG